MYAMTNKEAAALLSGLVVILRAQIAARKSGKRAAKAITVEVEVEHTSGVFRIADRIDAGRGGRWVKGPPMWRDHPGEGPPAWVEMVHEEGPHRARVSVRWDPADMPLYR
jgi:hypothetical protein